MRIPEFGRKITIVLAAALLAPSGLTVSGCGGSGGSGESSRSGTVTVLAAASLTEAFTSMGEAFEATNPHTKLAFVFGGSSSLAHQINSGAPGDVFASASPTNMEAVTRAGNAIGQPRVFARNQLVIAVPAGNPHKITRLADIAASGMKVALCAEQVPCGAAARKALSIAGVNVTPVTYELDVKATLAKLTLGEVDAALVYRTDVQDKENIVEGVNFSESDEALNDYPIVVLKNSHNLDLAKAFIAYAFSEEGRKILASKGFL